MIITPRIRGFICTTAHPVGCAWEVERQIDVARGGGAAPGLGAPGLGAAGPRNALVLGASMGYGLASRIAVAFGARAATIGVFLEREASDKRAATAGWYNSAAFHAAAERHGLYAESINGDAFSTEVKQQVVELAERDLGPFDLVVYSLAAPRRTMPDGSVSKSVLKPIGEPYTNKTVDVTSGEVSEVTIEPTDDKADIDATVDVMGGGDWEDWIDALGQGGVLAPDATTVAYSYIGPELTFPIYRNGTIGRAKEHLEATAGRLADRLAAGGGRAFVSVNKAVVTQSSSAIPVVPLYISLLFAVMKERGHHEGCIEQMTRLTRERLYAGAEVAVDDEGRIRLDDLEMLPEVQDEVARRWEEVSTGHITELADLDGYRDDFLRLFGFGIDGVDYQADVEHQVEL